MERKLIYLIVLLVLAAGLTFVSLAEIARVGLFNMTIFDLMTQPICQLWINQHPLTFISLKVTLFMASIQLSLYLLITVASWKELAYCKCLFYFMPVQGISQLVSTCLFLKAQWSYTSTIFAYSAVDPTLCQSFECMVSPAFVRVWNDTVAYIIVYMLFLVAYCVIFFLRMQLFDKPLNQVQIRRTENDELNAKAKVLENDLSIDNVSQLYM